MLPRVKWSAQIEKVKSRRANAYHSSKGTWQRSREGTKKSKKRVIGIITHLLRYLLLDAFYFLTRFAHFFFRSILALFPLFNDFTPLLERSMWESFLFKTVKTFIWWFDLRCAFGDQYIFLRGFFGGFCSNTCCLNYSVNARGIEIVWNVVCNFKIVSKFSRQIHLTTVVVCLFVWHSFTKPSKCYLWLDTLLLSDRYTLI